MFSLAPVKQPEFSIENGPSTSGYLTPDRKEALGSTALVCLQGAAFLFEASGATFEFPPVGASIAIAGGLSVATCVAMSVISLAPMVSDSNLKNLNGNSAYLTPGIFLAPLGAVAYGEPGMKISAQVGAVASDVYSLKDGVSEIEKKGLSALRISSLALDSVASYFDIKDLWTDLGKPRESEPADGSVDDSAIFDEPSRSGFSNIAAPGQGEVQSRPDQDYAPGGGVGEERFDGGDEEDDYED